jgi:hypothetical protein
MGYTIHLSIDLPDDEERTIEEALQELRKRLYAGFLPDFTVNYVEDDVGNEWEYHEVREMLKTLPMPWESNTNSSDEEAPPDA